MSDQPPAVGTPTDPPETLKERQLTWVLERAEEIVRYEHGKDAAYSFTQAWGELPKELMTPAPDPSVGTPQHQHEFAEFTVCRHCGQTEAAIEGCHHCNETVAGQRCWWCLKVRAAGTPQQLCDCCERPLGDATTACPHCGTKFAVGTPPSADDQTELVENHWVPYDRLQQLLTAEAELIRLRAELHERELTHETDTADLERLNAELTRLRAERDHYLETLAATRDVLAAFGKQAGWLPEQQGYSTRMAESERELADAVAAVDVVLSGAARLSREPHQD